MDRLDAMALFVSAVEQGSLAAAARRHGRSAAAATRAIARLEQGCGEQLLFRSSRKLAPTPAGDRHLAIWREVLERLRDAEAGHRTGSLQGGIVLTAPELFGRLKVLPVLEQFLRDHPDVAARVLLLNRVADLVGEGIDLAVRLAPLPDSALTAIRLGTVRTVLCASPAYLTRIGPPAIPQDLFGHDCIGLDAEGDFELWAFASRGPGAPARSLRVRTRLGVNNAAAGIEAALRGYGIVRARSYQVADDIAAGRLVRLLPAFEPPPTPAHLVFQPERGGRGVVRAFIDAAVPALKRDLRDTEAMLS